MRRQTHAERRAENRNCNTCGNLDAERQCALAWDDGGTRRRIVIAPAVGMITPAEHVRQFWCLGEKWIDNPDPWETVT